MSELDRLRDNESRREAALRASGDPSMSDVSEAAYLDHEDREAMAHLVRKAKGETVRKPLNLPAPRHFKSRAGTIVPQY